MDDLPAFDVLVHFFNNIDVLLLIFVRVLGFSVAVPFISSQNIWMLGRLFLALCVAVALFMSGTVSVVHYMDTTLGYVYLLILEFLVGMAMGYVVFVVFNLIFFAGQLMDFQIGLMMVNVLDPMTQIQVPITGNLFYFVLMAMLVATSGIHVLFGTFFYSYDLLPIGTAYLIGNSNIAWYIVHLLVQTTIMAVRLSMPIVGTMMIINVALGIMVKTVPQMNVFVVGLPLKLLVGITLFWMVMAPGADTIYWNIFDMAHNAMIEVIWGMRTQ